MMSATLPMASIFLRSASDVGDEAEHSPLALLAHHLDDVDAVEVCASGNQPGTDGVLDVILRREPDDICPAGSVTLVAGKRLIGRDAGDEAAADEALPLVREAAD